MVDPDGREPNRVGERSRGGDRPRRSRSESFFNSRLLIPCALLFSFLLPIALWIADPAFVRNTYGDDYEVFELFGLGAAAALFLIAGRELRRQQPSSLAAAVPVLAFLVVCFCYLFVIVEFSIPSWDYRCYEDAARAILNGRDPYAGTNYLYPPLPAQALALLHQGWEWVARIAGRSLPAPLWDAVFFTFQAAQFWLLVAAFLLCRRLASKVGAGSVLPSLLTAGLFLANNPLFRTVRFNQVNLWLLDLILIAVLFARRQPHWAGLSIALATHIKLTPAALLLPWLALGRWKPVLWAVIGIGGLLALSAAGGSEFRWWQAYFGFLGDFPQGSLFRDNSIHSVVQNLFRVVSLATGGGPEVNPVPVRILAWTVNAVLAGWLVRRFRQREVGYRRFVSLPRDAEDAGWAEMLRWYGHLFDALLLAFLVSPLVWEHHYVLATPVLLWAILARGRERPFRVGWATCLILLPPTFDVFPLSYHRLAGLFLLLTATAPHFDERGRMLLNPEGTGEG